jgi:hypothetical protein
MKPRYITVIPDHRDGTIGDIQTHCGFKEPLDPMHGWGTSVNKACDEFMLSEYGMEWVSRSFGQGDYMIRQ